MRIGIVMIVVLAVAIFWPSVVGAMMRRDMFGLRESRARYMALAFIPDAVLVVLLLLVFFGGVR